MILADKQDVKKMEQLVTTTLRQLEDHFELTSDQNVSPPLLQITLSGIILTLNQNFLIRKSKDMAFDY